MIGNRIMDAGGPRAPHGRLWELLMRYLPLGVALSLLVLVTGSAGTAGVAVPTDPRAKALVQTGRDMLAHGDIEGATDSFEAALAVDPGNPVTYLALGDAARAASMQGKAIHYYREALERDPNNLAALSGEGGAMAEKGALDKAKGNLARLEGLCGRNCPEAQSLFSIIAKGPVARVVSADAVKPDPAVEAN
jgi:cytochrome c-type biogenesis protein CcmH/NrfG